MSRKRKRKRKPRNKRPTLQAKEKPYPSSAERERIIERRDKLLRELVEALIVHQGDIRRIDKLARRYGPQEVQLVLSTFQQRASSAELIGEEASTYRAYRRAFARSGGDKAFLSMQEYSDLSFEHGKLHAERVLKSVVFRRPSAREREMRDTLFVGAALWEDITPPAVPPRPPDFASPAPGEYDYPARQLLDWGWDLDEERAKNNARNVSKWRPAIGDLARMALDDGLLNGWPGERASWAPYHALNMLGYLRAHQVAGGLFPLFGQENDWLSDRLAEMWGQMGPQAEPPLWDYLSDDEHDPNGRSVVMLGLMNIAKANPGRRSGAVGKLAGLLQRSSADDTKANAYIVHILNRLEATEAAETIAEAFEQGKVDRRIVDPESISILDWDDPDLYDRFYGQK